MPVTRIVVADKAEAIFYEAKTLRSPIREVDRISDPTAQLPLREQLADKPGRSYDIVGEGRHAVGSRSNLRLVAAQRFAKRVGRRLDLARRSRDFDRLVLIAAPRFLGVLRRSLSGPTRAMVSHEVAKDLVHEPAEAVRKWLRP